MSGSLAAESTQNLTESIVLVQRAQDGDQEALDRLIERYYPRVRRVVRMRLGKPLRRHIDSGDILQETFMGAVKAFDQFEMRDEGALINWLATIAERKILSAVKYHRAQCRDMQREIDAALTPEADGAAVHEALPFENAVRSEYVDVIEDCLDELRLEEREVIILRNYTGASWETVKDAMELPSVDAARMRYVRALRVLSDRVGGRTQS